MQSHNHALSKIQIFLLKKKILTEISDLSWMTMWKIEQSKKINHKIKIPGIVLMYSCTCLFSIILLTNNERIKENCN